MQQHHEEMQRGGCLIHSSNLKFLCKQYVKYEMLNELLECIMVFPGLVQKQRRERYVKTRDPIS